MALDSDTGERVILVRTRNGRKRILIYLENVVFALESQVSSASSNDPVKKKKAASGKGNKRKEREVQKEEIVEELKEKHQNKWSIGEYRLWAESIVRVLY